MVNKVIIALILFSLRASAQTDSLQWVQVRGMGANGSEDVWIRTREPKPIPKSVTIIIHDTVWAIKPLMRIDTTAPPVAFAPFTPTMSFGQGTVTFMGSGIIVDGTDWYGDHARTSRRRKRRHHPGPKETYEAAHSYMIACNLDTVYGILIYNNRRANELEGNDGRSEGYWVGCGGVFFRDLFGVKLVPGRIKKTTASAENGKIRKQTTGYYSGRFFRGDGSQVPNWTVYSLVAIDTTWNTDIKITSR